MKCETGTPYMSGVWAGLEVLHATSRRSVVKNRVRLDAGDEASERFPPSFLGTHLQKGDALIIHVTRDSPAESIRSGTSW